MDGLRLVEGDVLDQRLDDLVEAPWDLVANLPYHITSPVLHRVLEHDPRPERIVLMLQREVAERVAAPDGGKSYLSVFVQYHAHVSVARVVPARAFEPAPDVQSAILVGTTHPRRLSARRGDRPVAPGPGGVPGAAQDAPQCPAAAAAGRGPRTLRARPRGRGHRRRSATPDAQRGGVDGTTGSADAAAMSTLRPAAAAKYDLALAVSGRREDGYHLLRSVFLPLALHDVLEAEVDSSATADALSIEGELEASPDNLVLRTTTLLRQAAARSLLRTAAAGRCQR